MRFGQRFVIWISRALGPGLAAAVMSTRKGGFQKMPRSVLQSNWYYDAKFDPADARAKAFRELDRHGYDQIATGSNYYNSTNFELLAAECRRSLGAEHLLGFLQTPWKATLEKHRQRHIEAIEQVARAIQAARGGG